MKEVLRSAAKKAFYTLSPCLRPLWFVLKAVEYFLVHPLLSFLNKIFYPFIGFPRGMKSAQISGYPCFLTVHARINASCKWKVPSISNVAIVIREANVIWPVDLL